MKRNCSKEVKISMECFSIYVSFVDCTRKGKTAETSRLALNRWILVFFSAAFRMMSDIRAGILNGRRWRPEIDQVVSDGSSLSSVALISDRL